VNIFALSYDPIQSAKWHVDKHCVKMILETAQILCTNFHLQGLDAPYKPTHANHPSTIWARSSVENMLWTLELGFALLAEYRERFGKIHKSGSVIEWCSNNIQHLKFDMVEMTKFALAMPVEYQTEDPVESYRNYYRFGKKNLHQWKQNRPDWI
jgi:hypothetical protein